MAAKIRGYTKRRIRFGPIKESRSGISRGDLIERQLVSCWFDRGPWLRRIQTMSHLRAVACGGGEGRGQFPPGIFACIPVEF